MHTWQERVVREHKQLAEKVEKLEEFIASSPHYAKLPVDDKVLLTLQKFMMEGYVEILMTRMQRFEGKPL